MINETQEVTVEDKIRVQQLEADLAISIVREAGGEAIVAGGAPRDWFFGNSANDIDVFVENSGNLSEIVLAVLNTYGNIKVVTGSKGYGAYNQSSYCKQSSYCALCDCGSYSGIYGDGSIVEVYEVDADGQRIQFIFVNEDPVENVKAQFQPSLSQAIYTPEAGSIFLEPFVKTIQTGVITCRTLSNTSVQKTIEKFPDFLLQVNDDTPVSTTEEDSNDG